MMPEQFQTSLIRRISLFANLPAYSFEMISKAFEARRYKMGDYILMQGTAPDGVLVMAQGQAVWIQVAPDGSSSQLGTMQVGQTIHEEALLRENVKATAHLQATAPTMMLVLTRKNLLALLAQNPELKTALGFAAPIQGQHPSPQFKIQHENEVVLLKTRRHWFAFVRWLWIPLLITGMLLAAAYLIPDLAAALIPFAFVVGGGIALYQYLEWANDFILITDQRVLRLTYTIPTFHELRSEISLKSIQDIHADYPQMDIFAWLLNYGNLEIKTAGPEGNLYLTLIPSPEKLQELIIDDARTRGRSIQSSQVQARVAEVESWINPPKQFVQEPVAYQLQPIPKKGRRSEAETVHTGPSSPFIGSFKTPSGNTVYRKHWTVWVGMVFLPLILMFASSIAVLWMLFAETAQEFGALGWALSCAALLFGVIWFFMADWDWRNDFYLISDSHIILVNRRPLLQKNQIEQILLINVQSVESETSGILQRILRYGAVRVALLGADAAKRLDNVAFPLELQGEISRRQQFAKRRAIDEIDRNQRDAVKEYMSLYHVGQTPIQNMPYDNQQPRPSPYGQRGASPNAAKPEASSSAVPPKPQRASGRPPKFPRRQS